MLKSYKTEINPTPEQKQIINRTVGVCGFVYNFYLAHNKEMYTQGEKFMSGMDFSKWLNNEFISDNAEYTWIKEVYAKAVKQSIMNAHKAFMRFFAKQSKFPKFKKKNKSDVKMYFVKNDAKMIIECERHRIKIPTLGWVQVKEKGYIPTNRIIKSGTVSKKANRYYASLLVEVPDVIPKSSGKSGGMGIDLGIKDFAVISDGRHKKNINKKSKVKKTEKKLRREQRRLSRKYESSKKRNKILKGEATRQNIEK